MVEKFDEVVEQLSTGSHRAAVVLGAAKLDQALLSKCLNKNLNITTLWRLILKLFTCNIGVCQ